MTYSAMAPTRRAVVQRLRACEALMAMLKGGVHDKLPETAEMPYVVYESAVETPNDYMGQGGHFTDVTVLIYTDDASTTRAGRGVAGFVTGDMIAEVVMRELLSLDTPLVVAGHDVADLSLVGINSTRVDNPKNGRLHEISFTAELEDDLVE